MTNTKWKRRLTKLGVKPRKRRNARRLLISACSTVGTLESVTKAVAAFVVCSYAVGFLVILINEGLK